MGFTCVDSDSPSAGELAVMEEFLTLLEQDAAPGVEEFLARVPQYADSLRPVLEGAVMVRSEYREFRQRHPEVDLGRLLRLQG